MDPPCESQIKINSIDNGGQLTLDGLLPFINKLTWSSLGQITCKRHCVYITLPQWWPGG